MKQRRTHVTALLGFIVAALSLIATAGGCEAIVGDSVPSPVACTGPSSADSGNCPPNSTCVNGICQSCGSAGCVVVTDAGHDVGVVDSGVDSGHDAGIDDAMDGATEATPPEASSPLAIGDSCTTNAQCASSFCAPSSDLPGLTLSSLGVCSAPCCSDADCGGSAYQCYPTTGGNLCVLASTASRSCGGSCGTPCCSDNDCASTSKEYCGLGATQSGSFVPSCQPFSGHSGGAANDPCGADTDCKSGLCDSSQFGICQSPIVCCNDSDCAASGTGSACGWFETTDSSATGSNTSVVFRGCQAPQGNKPSGSSCTGLSDTQCVGSVCATFATGTYVCTQPCCVDSDCASAGAGWTCRPYETSLGVGNVALFVCQPPKG